MWCVSCRKCWIPGVESRLACRCSYVFSYPAFMLWYLGFWFYLKVCIWIWTCKDEFAYLSNLFNFLHRSNFILFFATFLLIRCESSFFFWLKNPWAKRLYFVYVVSDLKNVENYLKKNLHCFPHILFLLAFPCFIHSAIKHSLQIFLQIFLQSISCHCKVMRISV